MATDPQNLVKRPLYLYDLPREILASLYPVGAADSSEDAVSTSANGTMQSVTNGDDSVKATACTLCGLAFASVQDQRAHARSDLHRYNLKQKIRGAKVVTEAQFEELVGGKCRQASVLFDFAADHKLSDLDESLSGSDSSDSDADSEDYSRLGSLLKRQANVTDDDDAFASTKKRPRGSGKPPLIWLSSPQLPTNTQLGVWRVVFAKEEQQTEAGLHAALKAKQLEPVAPSAAPPPPRNPPEGGVALPAEAAPVSTGPSMFLCMIGGGHFAAMIVSLAPKITKNQNADASRNATVIAHKTFHRYTTRRKQGGSQSANDSSKGNAHSAGSSLRRYNEMALINDVRTLLGEWKPLLDQASLLFVRATGKTNRSTLFGASADDGSRPLKPDDPRLRGFPFSTRRATEGELMRCFVELTRLKVRTVDPEAEAAAAAAEEEKARTRTAEEEARRNRQKDAAAKQAAAAAEDQEATMHTTQLTALIRRSKAPALLSYLTSNSLSANYKFCPPDAPAHYHAPTPLHLAASNSAPALVTALLTKTDADPTIINLEGQTPFIVASDRATRDAFRVARSELGEDKFDWDKAGVPPPLTREEVSQRSEAERKEKADEEAARRREGLSQLKEEEERKEDERRLRGDEAREKMLGKGKSLGTARGQITAEQRRAQDAQGMTPELQARMEREKRARAADERLRRMQAAAANASSSGR